ncbi:McrB family protein [Helicobacter bizzozeronii]|uniref:McrB domain protein n=1 Tax=Helicobacter bizzozeronii (strain CIII-1) TaxID=1002804 RepID=F8KPQ2_HELBC|nr:AAA family ATPase [Helicobacter bizzozeronii]CCB80787.1 mcrB domain protein [Helicobacter bizzozeronii CIII-1]
MADSKYPLNQILYGPPGTGKTYQTINKALEILGFKDDEAIKNELKRVGKSIDGDERIRAKALFDHYKEEGRIEFVTFHQSYSYEEFVEGIRPDVDKDVDKDKGDRQVVYRVKDGIFKKICERAREVLKNQFAQETNDVPNQMESHMVAKEGYKEDMDYLDQLIHDFAEDVKKIIRSEGKFVLCDGKKEYVTIRKVSDDEKGASKITGKEVTKYSFKLGGSIKEGTQGLARHMIERDYFNFKSGKIKRLQDIQPWGKSKREYHGNAQYYYPLYKKIYEYERDHFKAHPKPLQPSLSIEDSKKKVSQNKGMSKQKEIPNYILIIDEINRGNLASILGEIITLIEPSKRLGNSEELKVILPYSQGQKKKKDKKKKDQDQDGQNENMEEVEGEEEEKELFGVPNNLYIIGTMNTADKNIALMDTALRRRFTFVEMMSKPDELKNRIKDKDNQDTGISLETLLRVMNKRIEFLLDRHHTIGHTYFLGLETLEDLQECFANKIIPLLQEYFYDDYAKIDIVLNGNGMLKGEKVQDVITKDKAVKVVDKLEKSFKSLVDTDKKVYKITELNGWDGGVFKKI